MSNTPQVILDFINPTPEMFQRDGENPISAIVATVPDHSELVVQALEQLHNALLLHMAPEDITILLEEQIQLHTGKVVELHEHSLIFGLNYPTAPGRIFELELSVRSDVTLH